MHHFHLFHFYSNQFLLVDYILIFLNNLLNIKFNHHSVYHQLKQVIKVHFYQYLLMDELQKLNQIPDVNWLFI